MSDIHPTAFVDPQAELGDDVSVGAFSYVGPAVRLGDGCRLQNHVSINGPAIFGVENVFHPNATLGAAPQDLKYKGGPTTLLVGDRNTFRELVTVHRGTEVDERSAGVTRIGSDNLFMVGVHIAHDAEIEDHVILANYVQVAGHVRLERCVNVGGLSAMHHFVTVGRYSFVGGMTRITADSPPYMKVSGYDGAVRAVNIEGLRRWKASAESQTALKEAFRLLYARREERGVGQTQQALAAIESAGLASDEHVAYLVAFLRRQMRDGVFGRSRESERSDSDSDRANFYTPASNAVKGA